VWTFCFWYVSDYRGCWRLFWREWFVFYVSDLYLTWAVCFWWNRLRKLALVFSTALSELSSERNKTLNRIEPRDLTCESNSSQSESGDYIGLQQLPARLWLSPRFFVVFVYFRSLDHSWHNFCSLLHQELTIETFWLRNSCMSAEQKIMHGCGPSNTSRSIFVSPLMFAGLHNRFPSMLRTSFIWELLYHRHPKLLESLEHCVTA